MLLRCKAGHDNERTKCLPIVSLVSGMKSLLCCLPSLTSESQNALHRLRFRDDRLDGLYQAPDVNVAIIPKLPRRTSSQDYFNPYRSPSHNGFIRERRIRPGDIGSGNRQVILSGRRMGSTRSRMARDTDYSAVSIKPEKGRRFPRVGNTKNSQDMGPSTNDSTRCVSCLSSNLRNFGKRRRPIRETEVYTFSRTGRSCSYEIVHNDELAAAADDEERPPLCENREMLPSSKFLGGGANSAFTPVTNRRQRKSKRAGVLFTKPSSTINSDNAADDEMDHSSDDQTVAFECQDFLKFIYPVGRPLGKHSMLFSNGTSDSSGIGVDSVYSLLGAEAPEAIYRSAASMPQTLSISEIELDSEQNLDNKLLPVSFQRLSPVKVQRRRRTMEVSDRRFKEAIEDERVHFYSTATKAAPVNSFLSLSCFQETVL